MFALGRRARPRVVFTPFLLAAVGDLHAVVKIRAPSRRPFGERCHVPSVVKINVLTVPAEQRETLEKRFSARAGAVESSDGFEWFELLRPVEGTDQYLVYTRWRSEEDFQNWTESRAFAEGHAQAAADAGHGHGHGHGHGGPAASGAELWSFEVVERATPKE